MYPIRFYRDRQGHSPIDVFLDGLHSKVRSKVQAALSLLERDGPNLKRPYADHVRGKIRELRISFGSHQYRILYFFQKKGQIVLVHAFSKKAWKLREQDLDAAERRMRDWISRHI